MSASSYDLVRAIRGPVLLIAAGLLFTEDYFGQYPFYKTWPVLLIVYGLMKLLAHAIAPRESPRQTPAGGSV
jgi:hypothetical protein